MAGRVATAWRSESAARAVTVVRIGAWVVLAFFLLLIDLSFSKSAWLAALVLGLIMVASMLRTWRRRAAGLAAIAVVATLFLLTSVVTAAPASDRNNSFDPNSSEGEVSITERYLATEAALHMTIDHPLFGVGPGLFGAEYAGPYRLPETKVVLQAAHNLIPNVAAEYGLPLAVLLSVTVVAALWVAWRLYRAGAGLAKVLAWAYGLALFGSMIVATLFGSDLYRTYRYMNTDVLYIGVLLGAICVLATIAKESPEASAIPE
jgi:O-antigen ligase